MLAVGFLFDPSQNMFKDLLDGLILGFAYFSRDIWDKGRFENRHQKIN